ncbi:MAG: M3 family metallopeptidase [Candidatus Krumholzibacteriota bacterium]|nr:M3 family metallopeptidase [Candidatus Krumholzibacteriota bacterium]
MRKRFILLGILALLVLSCSAKDQNPFFSEFDTPFGVPAFDKIKEEHYMPAFKEAIKLHDEEIDAITNNSEPASFANTIEAIEKSGAMLTNVANVFFGLNSANTNEVMQGLAKEVGPMLAEHQDNFSLNGKLFQRVKVVHSKIDELGLTVEQRRLLEDYYRGFVRGGADLDEDGKAKLRELNQELTSLGIQFAENVLKETNRFELLIDKKEDLAGLPDAVIAGAAEAAAQKGYEGKWLFTIQKPSMLPFIQYSEKRELREKIYRAYFNMGDNNDELDNKKILSKIAALRVKKANLLGYRTYAHFVLEENMSKNSDTVFEFLDKLWPASLQKAKEEAAELQAMIDEEGGGFKLESWDWWYYSEKVKKAKYDLDEEMLKPYFVLDNVINGAFGVATRLWGITFEEIKDIPKYHKDVRVFEVKEANGDHIGVLYTDYYPRESKRGGAWMGAYRKQSNMGGKMVTPVITNVGNFQKPTADQPALLTWDDVLTLFHEFGHGLHGLLTNCTYPGQSGTSVATDFVELPSQIMENWAGEPEVLATYAKHYKTGEIIPDELVEKMKKSSKFNQGFATTEYLAASYLDMYWHSLSVPVEHDVIEFENKALEELGLIHEIKSRYRSTYFRHIFSGAGDYAAGYFSYMWAEVLDQDAFQAFRETEDIFNKKLASSFRKNILGKGGSEDPMVLYRRFRGADPSIEPLLRKRGLI